MASARVCSWVFTGRTTSVLQRDPDFLSHFRGQYNRAARTRGLRSPSVPLLLEAGLRSVRLAVEYDWDMQGAFRPRRITKWRAFGLCAVILGMWGASQQYWIATRVGERGFVSILPGRVQLGVDDGLPAWARGSPRYEGTVMGRWQGLPHDFLAVPPHFIRVPNSHCKEVNVPFWLLFFSAAVPTGIFLFVDRRRPLSGRCHRCSYDLTGNMSGVCPECGTKIGPAPAEPAPRA